MPGAGTPGQCTSLCEKIEGDLPAHCCDGTVIPTPNNCPVEPICDGSADQPAACCDGTVKPRPEPPICPVIVKPPPTEPKPPGDYPKVCLKFDPHNQELADQCCGTAWGNGSPVDCQATCDESIVPAEYCCDGTVSPEPKVCTGGWPFLTQGGLDNTLKVLGLTI